MKKIILLMIPVFIIAIMAFSPKGKHTVSGTISGENNTPIAGASIIVKGTQMSKASDKNGFYSIEANGKDVLAVSAVGYKPQEIKINNRTVINIKLVSDATALTEVVVTASAIRKKTRHLGYSTPMLLKQSGIYLQHENFNTEDYDNITENGFHKVINDPLSTFSIDVDAASYSNVRRFLIGGQLPPAGAVRTEELINYFKYNYPQPTDKHPFSITTEMSACPWNNDHKLVMIGLQGKNIPVENLPPSNLVFLIDVSGSMMSENKLPLVKSSLKMLTDQLREKDNISIVVYAGSAGLVLPSTSGSDKMKIKTAIDALEAGGSTAGGAGITLAYKTAKDKFMNKGNNRVILCTDGDFNVGASSDDELVRMIEKEREIGVYLTVLGYGMGNYKDNKMQQLADKGNGNHAYIDGINEAKKVLVNEFGGTLFTIAKDVKLQVEFNPAKVAGYRLIGYENRMLNKEDFNDDKKDAGELGSGHTVTALYEIIPFGIKSSFLKEVDLLKYQKNKIQEKASIFSNELFTVKFRYKEPTKNTSELIVHPVQDKRIPFNETSNNFRFATAVAGFGMLLRQSEFKGNNTYNNILQMANDATGDDKEGYRKEFITLVKKAAGLSKNIARVDNDFKD
ncbi:MAG: von Willebrand factor type A domain-containing protein [Chitinophagaceae bacterium]